MKKIEVEFPCDFYYPPLYPMPDIPCCLHHGAFLVKRRFDVHTGVDLYTAVGTKVHSIEDGEIVKIRPFTGKIADCDHWLDTWAVDVEGHTGIISYGEIKPSSKLKEGDSVKRGSVVGNVLPVIKEYKGKPMSMLHFAIHSHGWKYLVMDQDNPELEKFYDLQIDPTSLLIQLKNKSDFMLHEQWTRNK